MKATERERRAFSRLGEVLLECVLAHEEGRTTRRGPVPKPEVIVHLEQTATTPAPADDSPAGEFPGKHLLDPKEAARFLSIGSRMLWSMTTPRGSLPSVRIGRLVRYPVEDLKQALNSMRVKPRIDPRSRR